MYKIAHIITLLFLVFFSACSSQNQAESSSNNQNSKLTIVKAPIADGTDVSTLQMLSLEFSVPINPDTITSSSVYIANDANVSISSELTLDSNNTKVTIQPYLFLQASTTYTFVVTTDVQSAEGLSLSTPYMYTFTTKDDSTDDGIAVEFSGIKPSDTKTDVPHTTDISIQFSKDIAPISDTTGLIRLTDTNSDEVNGTIEFFNSTITFKPAVNLSPQMTYTVTLDASKITDMHGNTYDASATSWTFTTYQFSTVSSSGFKAFATLDLTSNAKKLLNISQYTNDIIVAVNNTSLDFVEITLDATTLTPTLTKLSSYDLNSTIYGTYNLDEVLFVATENNLNILSVTADGNVSNEPLSVDGKVYDLIVDNNIYLVGPQFGFKVYEDDGGGGFSLLSDVNTSGMIPINIELSKGSIGKRLHVADYNGGVNHYDENGTFVSRTDLNGSTRDLNVMTDSYGEDTYLFASNSIGITKLLDLNGSINSGNPDIELLSSANNIVSNLDKYSMFNVMYFTNKQKGVMVYINEDGYHYDALLSTTGDIIHSEVSSLISSYPVLVTLDAIGELNIFNSERDLDKPTYIGSGIMGQDIAILTFDEPLDMSSFTKNDFIFTDVEGVPVVFDMNVSFDGTGTVVELSATSSGVCFNSCDINTTTNILDLVGNAHIPAVYNFFSEVQEIIP